MSRLPAPGEFVAWRNPQLVKTRSWTDTFGEGPFVVVSVVDHSAENLPAGIIVLTKQGEQEISEAFLTLASSSVGA
jgi:hypothetical protein